MHEFVLCLNQYFVPPRAVLPAMRPELLATRHRNMPSSRITNLYSDTTKVNRPGGFVDHRGAGLPPCQGPRHKEGIQGLARPAEAGRPPAMGAFSEAAPSCKVVGWIAGNSVALSPGQGRPKAAHPGLLDVGRYAGLSVTRATCLKQISQT